MTFEEAIKAVKEGKKVTRELWKEVGGICYISQEDTKNRAHNTRYTICKTLGMKCITWEYQPTQEDMYAEDWCIYF